MPPKKKHLRRTQREMLLPCEYARKRNRNVGCTNRLEPVDNMVSNRALCANTRSRMQCQVMIPPTSNHSDSSNGSNLSTTDIVVFHDNNTDSDSSSHGNDDSIGNSDGSSNLASYNDSSGNISLQESDSDNSSMNITVPADAALDTRNACSDANDDNIGKSDASSNLASSSDSSGDISLPESDSDNSSINNDVPTTTAHETCNAFSDDACSGHHYQSLGNDDFEKVEGQDVCLMLPIPTNETQIPSNQATANNNSSTVVTPQPMVHLTYDIDFNDDDDSLSRWLHNSSLHMVNTGCLLPMMMMMMYAH